MAPFFGVAVMLRLVLVGGLLAGGVSAFQTRPGIRVPTRTLGRPPVRNRNPLTLAAVVDMAVDVSIDEDRNVISMQNWATNNGVQAAEGFHLTTQDGLDWSVATNQEIPAGSSVLFVPHGMILSSHHVRQEFGASIAAAEDQLVVNDLGDQIPLFALFVKILAEFEKEGDSLYAPWLDSLPKRYNNGASMTDACFECLLPYVSYLSAKERATCVAFGEALRCVPLDGRTVNNENLVKWAYNVAVTRSFDVDGDRRIVPMADMFNHGSETEIEINYDGEGNCIAIAKQNLSAGSPLRISYGDPTNPSPLFATYGFLDESSPATFCKLMDVQQEMQDMGVDFSRMLFYKDTGDISEEVWDVLLYHILASDTNLRQIFFQACMSGDVNTKSSYHQQYYSYTLNALTEHVQTTLNQLDELSGRAYTKDVETHPRIPVILKHNEFVKNTFLVVKSRLEEMA